MQSKGLLKSNTQSLVKYCHLAEFIEVSKACSDLSIKRRRMTDILIVLENIGMVRKVNKDWYKILGSNNLIIDQDARLYGSCVPLAILTRIVFRHLVDTGNKRRVIDIMHQLKIREEHWVKMNRRIYDILNVFDGANIIGRDLRRIQVFELDALPPPEELLPWEPIIEEDAGSASRGFDYC